jgi:hypothetical protein
MDSIILILNASSGPAYYCILALGIVVGSLAVISPWLFGMICEKGSHWVTTPLQITALDKKIIDTDRYVLRHCRLAGAAILVLAVAFAAAVEFAG